jgi:hypothetical protein
MLNRPVNLATVAFIIGLFDEALSPCGDREKE